MNLHKIWYRLILNKKNQPTIFIRLMSSNACIEYKYLYSCLNSYSDLIQTLYFQLVIHLDLLAIVIFHELTNPEPPEFLDYFINKIRICQNKNNSKERLDENVMEEIDSILIDINNRILKYIKSHINDNFKEEESEEFFKQYFYHISKSD